MKPSPSESRRLLHHFPVPFVPFIFLAAAYYFVIGTLNVRYIPF